MDVFDIIETHIEEGGFDGLYNSDGECACKKGDLAPCGGIDGDCEPGYVLEGDCPIHDYHIGPKGESGVCE
jgi:hypothetical protein